MSIAALRLAHQHLLGRRFAAALEAIAPHRDTPAAELIHALALAGTGAVEAAAPALAAIAAAHPTNRHPVLDLLPLIPAGAAPAHLRAALVFRPRDPALHAALGVALTESGPMIDAIEAFTCVTELTATDPAAWSNLGKALAAEARFDDADLAFRTARALAPTDSRIAYNHAAALLKAGRFDEGWPALAIRHALPGRPPPLPGSRLVDLDIAGLTVLLRHDEGFGDTLQFIRYAAPLAALGARVIAAMPGPLRRIVATAPGVAAVVGMTDLPRYDRWAPLLDVPRLFGGKAPTEMPYLRAEDVGPALQPGRKVGVVWAGDPAGLLDRQRSMPVQALAPLAERRDIAWISLQQGHTAPPWMHDPMATVRDFADTAAIVAQLDAVVSVDTAVAHLAGALGKPVLLMDRYDSCWRWLTGRVDSPWYPNLQIMRQPSPGDWNSVVSAIGDRLP